MTYLKGSDLRIFSCPKAFDGDAGALQLAAIESWKSVTSDILLVGPEQDIATIPSSLGVDAFSVSIDRSISELPLFSDLLEAVAGDRIRIHCYVNADILLPNLIGNLRMEEGRIRYGCNLLPERFLIVGNRWDLPENVDYSGDHSEQSFCDFIKEHSSDNSALLHDEHAMDFFIFPSGLFEGLAPLIVGRGGYDNALVAFCLRNKIPVIDSSREWPVLHQFHGYEHKAGGQKEVYLGKEAMFNRLNHGIRHSVPTALDADFLLYDGKLIPSKWRCGLLRRIELFVRFRLGLERVSRVFRGFQRLMKSGGRVSKREMGETARSILSRN